MWHVRQTQNKQNRCHLPLLQPTRPWRQALLAIQPHRCPGGLGTWYETGWRMTNSLLWKTYRESHWLYGCCDKVACALGGSFANCPGRGLVKFHCKVFAYIWCRWIRVVVLWELLFGHVHDPQIWRDRHEFGLYDRHTAVLDIPAEKGDARARLKRKSATVMM